MILPGGDPRPRPDRLGDPGVPWQALLDAP